MKYSEFRNKVKNYPLFRSNILVHLTENPNILRRQIVGWVKDRKIIQLKRGVYTLRDDDRSAGLSSYFLANQLYTPSYISLETALSYYAIIPEKVYTITSVTTKKTQQFQNQHGNYIYRHIKPAFFNHFIKKKDEFGNSFFIATPEKAVADFIYFKSRELDSFEKDIFDLSFRFQNLDILDVNKLKKIAKNLEQKKADQLLHLLIDFMGHKHD